MNDSGISGVKVCGHMGGVSSESESSSESTEGTIELEFEERNSASRSSIIEDETYEKRTPCDPDGVVLTSLTNPPSLNEDETRCRSGMKADATGSTKLEHRRVEDAFGINYKPCNGWSSQSYELPSGPAFVDEDEFEQDMSAEFRIDVASPEQGGRGGRSSTTSETAQKASELSVDNGDQRLGSSTHKKLAHDYTLQQAEEKSSSMLSSGDHGAQNGADGIPPHPVSLKRDSHEAFKQQPDKAWRLDDSARGSGDIHCENIAAVNPGASVLLGRDVRHHPVMEEEEEEEEEGETIDVDLGSVDLGSANNVERVVDQNAKPEGDGENQMETRDDEEHSRRARVAEEWEAIDQLRTAESSVPMEKGVGGTLQPTGIDEDNRMTSTEEVLSYFRSKAPESRFGLFRRAPKLKFSNGEQLRDEVFLLTKIEYNPREAVHRRLIQTIYRQMTKEKRPCPDVGPHWDTIGFQGTDPCTDLNRSMGIFALFQVLNLLETQLEFAMALYRISLADVTGWPFLCVSIGFTKEAIGVLRRGGCYSECNRRKCILVVVHELHQAQFHAFLELCRKEPATHHALHLAKIRERVENDSRQLVKAYRAHLLDKKAASTMAVVEKMRGRSATHELVDFSGGVKKSQDKTPRDGLALTRKKQYLSDEAPGDEGTTR